MAGRILAQQSDYDPEEDYQSYSKNVFGKTNTGGKRCKLLQKLHARFGGRTTWKKCGIIFAALKCGG